MASRFSTFFINSFNRVTDNKYTNIDIKVIVEEIRGEYSYIHLKLEGLSYDTGISLNNDFILSLINNPYQISRQKELDSMISSIMMKDKFGEVLIRAITKKKIQIWKNIKDT
jgi:hypothetical protein